MIIELFAISLFLKTDCFPAQNHPVIGIQAIYSLLIQYRLPKNSTAYLVYLTYIAFVPVPLPQILLFCGTQLATYFRIFALPSDTTTKHRGVT